jgi:hypothetical protein
VNRVTLDADFSGSRSADERRVRPALGNRDERPVSPVASGQIKLRRIGGWRKIAAVFSQNTLVAA